MGIHRNGPEKRSGASRAMRMPAPLSSNVVLTIRSRLWGCGLEPIILLNPSRRTIRTRSPFLSLTPTLSEPSETNALPRPLPIVLWINNRKPNDTDAAALPDRTLLNEKSNLVRRRVNAAHSLNFHKEASGGVREWDA